MPNDQMSKRTSVSLVATIFKFVSIHEDYQEISTTTKLYIHDAYKNTINMIKDGIACSGIADLCALPVSIVKLLLRLLQRQRR
jgi:hypothetical protein